MVGTPKAANVHLIGLVLSKQTLAGSKNHCCCKEDRSRHGWNSSLFRVISWHCTKRIILGIADSWELGIEIKSDIYPVIFATT